VSELLTIMRRFPLGEGFIPEVKEALFHGIKAGTVDVTDGTAASMSTTAVMTVSRRVHRDHVQGGGPAWEV